MTEEGITISFQASAPSDVESVGLGTKTSMSVIADGYSVLWNPGDAISVNGRTSSSITIDPSDPKSATFVVNGINYPCNAVYPSAGLAFGGFVWANGGIIQNSTMNGILNIAYKPDPSLSACYGGGFAALGHTVTPYTGAGTINTNSDCKPGKFINCENKANIKVQTNTNKTARDAMGGICGLSYLDGVEFTTCKNSGKLETIPVLEKAKELFPESDKPYYYLGCLLYNKQQDAAAEQWSRCVEMNPQMDLAWRNLGWYNWLYTKNYDEAAKCYAKAVELAPEKALYLEEQEHVLEAKEEARKCFETSLELKNDNLWSKFMLSTLK